jgi:pimeloyl-ACP methyl ester carboxylesterase
VSGSPLLPWLAASLVLCACSQGPGDPTESTASAPSAGAADLGSPRIATSPDGVHIQYRIQGSGDPAVVLVHGWSCDSGYWKEQLDALAAKYTVLTVDLAGHGGSGRNRTDWSIANYGEDVAAAARELATPRLVLVGHSMGGPVVLEAAARLDDRVIGIIGVDTFKRLDQPPPPPATVERRIAEFREDFVGTTRTFVTSRLFPADANQEFVRKVAEDMSLAPPEIAIPSIAAVNALNFEGLLSRLAVPIVAINSDLPPGTDEERIRKTVPAFRAVVIDNTSHFLMMDAADRFNPILLKEIAALAAAQPSLE